MSGLQPEQEQWNDCSDNSWKEQNIIWLTYIHPESHVCWIFVQLVAFALHLLLQVQTPPEVPVFSWSGPSRGWEKGDGAEEQEGWDQNDTMYLHLFSLNKSWKESTSMRKWACGPTRERWGRHLPWAQNLRGAPKLSNQDKSLSQQCF